MKKLLASMAVGLVLITTGVTVSAGAATPPQTSGVDEAGDPVAVSTYVDNSPEVATIAPSTPGAVTRTAAPRTDTACVAAYQKAQVRVPVGGCTITDQVGASALEPATAKTDGAAVAKTNARCRTWYQEQWGGYPGTWLEKHIGKMCYADGQVWIWYFPGRTAEGYHYCDQGSVILYTLKVTSCSRDRVNSRNVTGGYFRQQWDRFKTSEGYSGLTITYSHDMHTNVFSSGNIVAHN